MPLEFTTMKKLLFAMLATLVTLASYAQVDTLYKVTGEIIPCKIKEIGDDQVKYTIPDRSSDIIFSTENSNISKIVLKNGDVMYVSTAMDNSQNYSDQNKHAFKVSFLAPVMGYFEAGVERSIKPGRSAEVMMSIVNSKLGNRGDETGFNVRAGIKFLKSPDFYMRGMRYSHILKGAYVRPDILISFLNHKPEAFNNDGSSSRTIDANTVAIGFNINLGKQIVYNDAFLIDYFIGVGYGFINGDTNKENVNETRRYGWVQGTGDVPLNFNLGLRVGGLF